MLALKTLLLLGAVAMFLIGAAVVLYDLILAVRYRRALAQCGTALTEPAPMRWRTSVALVAMAWAPLLLGLASFASEKSH
jgi:hypothetical protein